MRVGFGCFVPVNELVYFSFSEILSSASYVYYIGLVINESLFKGLSNIFCPMTIQFCWV